MTMVTPALSKQMKNSGTDAGALTKPKRKWRRRIIRFLLVSLAVGSVGFVWGRHKLNQIESQARLISETGGSLNSFLKKYVHALEEKDADQLLGLFADDYYNERDGDWAEELQSDRDDVQVYRRFLQNERPFRRSDLVKPAEQFVSNLGALHSAKFKISSIEDVSETAAVIRGVLWLRGEHDERTRESRTNLRLAVRKSQDSWLITRQEMLGGHTVIGKRTGFTDVTNVAQIAFMSHHNPMLNEEEWLPKSFGIMRYASAGVTTGDFDNDGFVDIFFADGKTPQLWRNKGDGTFEDVTSAVGLPTDLQGVHVALFVDLDNDGDRDLFVGVGTGSSRLFRNNGSGVSNSAHYTFTDVSEAANIKGNWVATACAADYDNDGLVDLYLGRYLDPRINLPTTNFYTRNSEGNSLLHNEGNLTFKDVTEQAGVREGGLSLGVTFGDYDSDGDQDLYVANDFGRNALFRNEADGTFKDVSQETGTVNIGYGMSATFADVDNDLDLDLYVAAVHSGQRWFGNAATLHRYLLTSIQEGTFVDDYPLYREMYDLFDSDWQKLGEAVISGNTLMLNQGDGKFTDVTTQANCNPHGWYWSSGAADFSNCGWQDIYSVNGWITGKKKDDL